MTIGLVTGGSKGIGIMLIQVLLEHGLTLFVIAKETQRLDTLKAKWEKRLILCDLDVRDLEGLKKVADKYNETLGGLSFIINNAGISDVLNATHNVCPEKWKEIVDVNLIGSFNVIHTFLPFLINNKEGAVINIVSSLAKTNGKYSSSYSVSKAALLRLTEILHDEYQYVNIRFFAINPGFHATPMTSQIINGSCETCLIETGLIDKKESNERSKSFFDLVVNILSGKCDSDSSIYISV